MLNLKTNQSGAMFVTALMVTAIFLASAIGLVSLGLYRYKLYLQETAKQQALHIAEAGINYYRWHLAHAPNDFYDGAGSDPGVPGAPYGPYEHNYTAPSSNLTGAFSLEITPPVGSSTIVRIKSTGWTDNYPNIKRTVEARYGMPSLAHYSFLTNANAWFKENASISGEAHANGGIRMDGSNNSLVASLKETYECGYSNGCCTCVPITDCWKPSRCPGNACCSQTKPGIWGAGAGSALWNYPVPIVDFNTITMDISQFQANALVFGPSGGSNKGYHIIFQPNGTFDVYKVNTLKAALSQFNDDWTAFVNIAEEINTQTLLGNYPIPANGQIFFEDDIWVEGTVNGRATIVAARLPDNASKRKTIHINNNINYLARDGNHILGLVAQKHIKVPRHAPTDLNIDAILLAQNGHVYRSNYDTPRVTNNITVYGGILSNKEWSWTWVSGITVTDGYTNTASIYDPQATYAPPPSFPTTSEYVFISWEEK